MSKKIRRFGEFVNEVQSLLGHCNLRSTDPKKDPDVFRAKRKLSDSDYFVIKKSASYNYFRSLNYLREQLKSNGIEISEDYLSNSYFNFLEERKRSGGDLSNECHTWLDGLKSLQLKQFKLLIPISHYDYR